MKPSEAFNASQSELVGEVCRLQLENASLQDALSAAIRARNRWGFSVILFTGIAAWRMFGGG